MPLVALPTTLDDSDGICADNVECLNPCSTMSFLNASQSIFNFADTIESTSFL